MNSHKQTSRLAWLFWISLFGFAWVWMLLYVIEVLIGEKSPAVSSLLDLQTIKSIIFFAFIVAFGTIWLFSWFFGTIFAYKIKKYIINDYNYTPSHWLFWPIKIGGVIQKVKNKIIIFGKLIEKEVVSKDEVIQVTSEELPTEAIMKEQNVKKVILNDSFKTSTNPVRNYGTGITNIKKENTMTSETDRSKDIQNNNTSQHASQTPQYTNSYGQPIQVVSPNTTTIQTPRYVTQTISKPRTQIISTTQRFIPTQNITTCVQPHMPVVDYTSVLDTSSLGNVPHNFNNTQVFSTVPATNDRQSFDMTPGQRRHSTDSLELSAQNLSEESLEKLRTLNFILENGGISYQEYCKKKRSIYLAEFESDKS